MKMNISPRDRMLLQVLAGALVLFVVYLLVDEVLQGYQGLDDQIALKSEELKKVSRLREQYLQTHTELKAVKAQLDGQQENFSLLSVIENLAKQEKIREKIGSMKPKTLPLIDPYEEKLVELKMDDVTLPQLVDFIYNIEHSGHILKVKRLRIKPRYNDRDLLSVVMQVTTFTRKT